MNSFNVMMFCVMLVILALPPHDPWADSFVAVICAIYAFLIAVGSRSADA